MRLSPIIEAEELLKVYKNSDVLLFDVSNSKNAKTNYETEHIEGAIFVDLNTQLSGNKDDISKGGRHPLPTPENFAKTLAMLGVAKDKHIIVYDTQNGSNAAARFWWMLTSVGIRKVQVLNGGLNQVNKIQLPLSSRTEMVTSPAEPNYVSQWDLPTIEIDQVQIVSRDPKCLVIDVRSKERFDGNVEPIDLIAGHIPGAINIPFTENLAPNGLFLKPEQLRKKYTSFLRGINPENIVIHCGSGVTACHTLLALAYAEMKLPKLYVGSWSEWSRRSLNVE